MPISLAHHSDVQGDVLGLDLCSPDGQFSGARSSCTYTEPDSSPKLGLAHSEGTARRKTLTVSDVKSSLLRLQHNVTFGENERPLI